MFNSFSGAIPMRFCLFYNQQKVIMMLVYNKNLILSYKKIKTVHNAAYTFVHRPTLAL